jgi:hypothetical protein
LDRGRKPHGSDDNRAFLENRRAGWMVSVTHRSETGTDLWRPAREPVPLNDPPEGFVAALLSGGDSRIAVDPHTGLNKYFCPEVPAPALTCVSSCTASPISPQGLARATAAYLDVVHAQSARQRAYRLTALIESIKTRLLQYFGVGALAHVTLYPSGTDAMLTTAMLFAAERPGKAMTAILPSASETGTGVPMAAMCRGFDGPGTGQPLSGCAGTVVEIPLRSADGSPRSADAINAAFAAATAAAPANAIVYLTHGTKTGLIAPVSPPSGVDVIVDACQARISPGPIAKYLGHGWPVVVTGSKFFGGPAFSGAIFIPRGRLPESALRLVPPASNDAAGLGTALRWTAALATIDALESKAAEMAGPLSRQAAAVEQALAANPALVPIGGLRPNGFGWADQPSIFTFAVRDPLDHARLLSVAQLRPLYERMARLGVLLGQPVGIGSFGGLRIAIGAQDLVDGSDDRGLARVFATLEHVVSQRRQEPMT